MPALTAENITSGYGRSPVIRDVSVSVEAGDVTAIVGPLLYTNAFALFTGPDAVYEFSGMPYVIAAIFSLVARAILAWGRT